MGNAVVVVAMCLGVYTLRVDLLPPFLLHNHSGLGGYATGHNLCSCGNRSRDSHTHDKDTDRWITGNGAGRLEGSTRDPSAKHGLGCKVTHTLQTLRGDQAALGLALGIPVFRPATRKARLGVGARVGWGQEGEGDGVKTLHFDGWAIVKRNFASPPCHRRTTGHLKAKNKP